MSPATHLWERAVQALGVDSVFITKGIAGEIRGPVPGVCSSWEVKTETSTWVNVYPWNTHAYIQPRKRCFAILLPLTDDSVHAPLFLKDKTASSWLIEVVWISHLIRVCSISHHHPPTHNALCHESFYWLRQCEILAKLVTSRDYQLTRTHHVGVKIWTSQSAQGYTANTKQITFTNKQARRKPELSEREEGR